MENNLYQNQDFTKPRSDGKLEPWQVTGLADGEGSFGCSLSNTGKGSTGYSVKLEFKITQKSHSEGVLHDVADYLDWKKIVELKNSGAHKTEEGFATMKKIVSNMNSTRDSGSND